MLDPFTMQPIYSDGSAPTLVTKVIHFSTAWTRWKNAGFPKRSKEEIKEIRAICAACPNWNPKGNMLFGECRHPKCGCTRFKPQWATEHCPIGKW